MKLKTVALISGALAVALGAFGAHKLKPLLDANQQSIWEKAVLYQFVHTLALVILLNEKEIRNSKWIGTLFVTGIVCFSGSLYLLATAHITWINTAVIGPVTPVGGMCFIAAWLWWAREQFRVR